MYRKLLPVFLALILAACQGGTLFNFGPTPTPFPEVFTGTAQVGDFIMTISCAGSGEPTILLESGLGGGSWGDMDLQRFKSITRVCWYPRVGLNPVNDINTPQTTMDQVKALHSLLEQTGVPGPYILVGHSLAGLNMPLFVNQYPKEVVGIVCVDCCPPLFWRYMGEQLDIDDTFDPQDIKYYLDNYEYWIRDPNNTLERIDLTASEEQLSKVTNLGDLPFVVLVKDGKWGDPCCPLETQLDQYIGSNWLLLNQELCDMSSRCRLEVVAGTNHSSILKNEAVDKAVQEVYDTVKQP